LGQYGMMEPIRLKWPGRPAKPLTTDRIRGLYYLCDYSAFSEHIESRQLVCFTAGVSL
jgi:hypothetical protein